MKLPAVPQEYRSWTCASQLRMPQRSWRSLRRERLNRKLWKQRFHSCIRGGKARCPVFTQRETRFCSTTRPWLTIQRWCRKKPVRPRSRSPNPSVKPLHLSDDTMRLSDSSMTTCFRFSSAKKRGSSMKLGRNYASKSKPRPKVNCQHSTREGREGICTDLLLQQTLAVCDGNPHDL